MQKVKLYFQDAFNELMNKVSWPTWAELQNSAIVVMIASLIIGLIIFLMDGAFSNLLKMIYENF
ncbi:MAG: preprotein translocase subunit SecE [Bacteroidia bacterium]|nr:preprotein translocase subunit SecE [Bacteroidia bacterium]NNM16882.1 preprotein translocase subunit SecE [Bacteroidia bacterium]